jgi:hypothetical protein
MSRFVCSLAAVFVLVVSLTTVFAQSPDNNQNKNSDALAEPRRRRQLIRDVI